MYVYIYSVLVSLFIGQFLLDEKHEEPSRDSSLDSSGKVDIQLST